MNHLVLYCHPNPKSFNFAIMDTYVHTLRNLAHDVRVRDIYSLDFEHFLNQDDFNLFEAGSFPEDIIVEHQHISWADVITFIYPIWWGGPPAKLKDYMDRVFCNGFAYAENDEGIKPLLGGKKGLTINTIGAPEDVYEKAQMFKSMNISLDVSFFGFTGMDVAGHTYFSSVGVVSDAARKKMLKEVKGIARQFGSAIK